MTTPFFSLYTERGALLVRLRLATASACRSTGTLTALLAAAPCDLARREDSLIATESYRGSGNAKEVTASDRMGTAIVPS